VAVVAPHSLGPPDRFGSSEELVRECRTVYALPAGQL